MVLIVLATIGALALIVLLLMVLSSGRGGSRDEARVAAKRADTEVQFTLIQPQALSGTSLLRMDIAAFQSRDRGGYSGSGDGPDIRNVLLVDKASGASWKLLPGESRRIGQTHLLPAKPDRTEASDSSISGVQETRREVSSPAYFLIELRRDATERGPVDIVVGTLAGDRRAMVMRNIDGVDEVWMHSPTQIGVVVREGLALYYRLVDVPTLKVALSRKIEIG